MSEALTAISPIDGRYWNSVKSLSNYFSEFALHKYRVQVEIEYFIALCGILPPLQDFPKENFENMRKIYQNFDLKDAEQIKATEAKTNHDVKAVEYFVKDEVEKIVEGWGKWKEFVHFGLTSQDINNTSIPLSLKDFINNEYYSSLHEVLGWLKKIAKENIDQPLLARTHGQPATPSRLGKEFLVFIERVENQMEIMRLVKYTGKFSGATGQFNAHFVAYPLIDWPNFADELLKEKFGLTREKYTTQIAHYDSLATLFDCVKRINTILIDLSRDMWSYISLEYFKLKTKEGEIGSSAMPHKVNPIDFENSEGNLGIANALFEHFSAKLPISRLQRDLSDSTVLRNVGVAFAHSVMALRSLSRGLSKVDVNVKKINDDLTNNWVVVSEAIQTVLRREGYAQPYELIKEATRGKDVHSEESMLLMIDSIPNISDDLRNELKKITPHNFIGVLPSYNF